MKNCRNVFRLFFLLACFIALFSCSKDIYEETAIKQAKVKPNVRLDFIATKSDAKILEPLLKKFSSKLKRTNGSNQNTEAILTLEGEFGTILLDQALELNAETYKTETFEVDEAVQNPNIYYNVVIDKDQEVWLYKMERLTQPFGSYPANSQLVTR